MDREQIEQWAREAGYVIGQDGPDDHFEVSMHRAQIEHFARLVRDAALEEAAAICDITPPQPFRPSIEAAHAIRQLRSKP